MDRCDHQTPVPLLNLGEGPYKTFNMRGQINILWVIFTSYLFLLSANPYVLLNFSAIYIIFLLFVFPHLLRAVGTTIPE